eukprot:TRINITY_DN12008_c0_g2_i4.p1 TRINITY_DN12008_c0_g2~~TRINITY_DN12008_c0_g2_i4.p1  ORF type:complete len:269 (+),score=48.54 TRINITY_DN12008_c0_g2_i4:88-807(+)
MSTAHRPTWAPAIGGTEQGGNREYVPSVQQSALNLPAHTKLKFRQAGQGSKDELQQKDLRAELISKETKHFLTLKSEKDFKALQEKDFKLLEAQSKDDELSVNGRSTLIPKAIDADDEDSNFDSESEDSDDDEDEEALLLAELEKIKKERAIEAEKKAQEDAIKKREEEEERIKRSNPLMAAQFGVDDVDDGSFNVKRRWDDDVVFKNQARGEPKVQKRFINDTIRNDFHKRFLTRYFR